MQGMSGSQEMSGPELSCRFLLEGISCKLQETGFSRISWQECCRNKLSRKFLLKSAPAGELFPGMWEEFLAGFFFMFRHVDRY